MSNLSVQKSIQEKKTRAKKRCAVIITLIICFAILPINAHAGFVDDAVDSILNSLAQALANGISSCFKGITELLGYSLDFGQYTVGSNGNLNETAKPALDGKVASEFMPSSLITLEPNKFLGGSTYTMIRNVSNYAIVPAAAFLLLIVLVSDLVQILTSGNQFEQPTVEILLKWFAKVLVGTLLVSNIYYIATGVFAFGSFASKRGMAEVAKYTATMGTVSLNVDSGDIGALLIGLILAIFALLLVMILFIVIIVTLAGRILDIFMHLAVAPIPAATFMNSEWKSMGYNWLKSLIALAFQGFLVVVCLAIFTSMFGTIVSNNEITIDNLVINIAILDGFLAALIFTVMRTGSIAKTVFNAS